MDIARTDRRDLVQRLVYPAQPSASGLYSNKAAAQCGLHCPHRPRAPFLAPQPHAHTPHHGEPPVNGLEPRLERTSFQRHMTREHLACPALRLQCRLTYPPPPAIQIPGRNSGRDSGSFRLSPAIIDRNATAGCAPPQPRPNCVHFQ